MGRKKKQPEGMGNGVKSNDVSWQRAIQDCMDCYAACMNTFYYVLHKNSSKRKNLQLHILLDCAEACLTAARFLLRKSRYYVDYTRLCMILCQECYEVCSMFVDDQQMTKCARMCSQCAKSCRRISNIG
jgi:hypothetical protein